jgi:RNA polymerase sigma-70 factor, ECF subfamily
MRACYRHLKFHSVTGLAVNPLEEIAQETFLRAYKNLSTYDSEKGASFSSWLFVIAKNLALNELARHHHKKEIKNEDESNSNYESAEDPALSVDDVLDENLTHSRLSRAMKTLPQIFQTALALSYLQDLSLEEAASIEGCSIGTIKSRVFRGKNLLRIALGEKGTES